MVNWTVIQTTQTKFSVEIFSWQQSKRHRNTNLDGNVSQFADFIGQKQGETQMGIFKHDLRYPPTFDELYQYIPLFGKSGGMLAGGNQRAEKQSSELAFPGNDGGLLLKIEKIPVEY